MSAARHGTPSGYNVHARSGEQPCDACRNAKAAYDRRRLQAPEMTRRSRLTAKAQSLALHELRRRYPDEYQPLFQSFKAALTLAEQRDHA